jgi:hypothetical protein
VATSSLWDGSAESLPLGTVNIIHRRSFSRHNLAR